MIVNFRQCRECAARSRRPGGLGDAENRGKPFEHIDGRTLPMKRIGQTGQRREEATLAFGEDRVENQRTFSGSAGTGHNDELPARKVERHIVQVVRASTTDADPIPAVRRFHRLDASHIAGKS